ncbi:DUF6538 domain-containing protein [Pseudomonas cichorii]
MFYLHRRVPEDLRPALGREYKRSLQTRDANEAKGSMRLSGLNPRKRLP